MTIEPRLDIIGAALADPSRARILCELMDGRAFTNKELASAACLAPQTASAHLKQLENAGLTTSLRSGRHVYHRISSPEVASVLETLSTLSPTDHLTRNPAQAAGTRLARSCYNHVAGRLGVLMTERMIATGVLRLQTGGVEPGPSYGGFRADLGVDQPAGGGGKAQVKLCLDWTERRFHVSGPFATALMSRALEAGWLRRQTGSRALALTPDGLDAFERWFGLQREALLPAAEG